MHSFRFRKASQQLEPFLSIQTFIKSFCSPDVMNFLEDIGDLSSIECSTQVIQSLAFIAGYAVILQVIVLLPIKLKITTHY